MATETQHLRVIELRAENLKRLKVVQLKPGNANVIEVTGRNSQGKSSVIDAIWVALQGAAMLKDIPNPVRNGADKATVYLDLGDYIVERTIERDKTPKLKVSARIGDVTTNISSPQTLLDSLLSDLCIDPTDFMRQAPKDQLTTFLGIVDTENFLLTAETKRKAVFDRRRDVGRDRDRVKGALDSMERPELPAEPIDKAAALDELDRAQAHNAKIDGHKKNIERAENLRDTERAKIERLREEIAVCERTIATCDEQSQRNAEALAALTPIDVAATRQKIEQADREQALTRQAQDYDRMQHEFNGLDGAYNALTAALEEIDASKGTWLAEKKLPVPGIAFDVANNQVLYNGVPLKQCSSSEQLRVSLMIAMAQAPKLRVIRIKDGNCLDSESMAVVEEMAGANDFQLWVERVDESGEIGVVIEDGEIKTVNADEVEPAEAETVAK